MILTSPVTGRAAALTETPDTLFASGLMGAGALLYPSEGLLRAPCDGVVDYVLPQRYALGLKADQGLELLLQVGIDTDTLTGWLPSLGETRPAGTPGSGAAHL